MKKITLAFVLLGAFAAKAQNVENDSVKPVSIESLQETVDGHTMKFEGLDERLSEMSGDLNSLKKLKISGYIQAQYDLYDTKGANGVMGSTFNGSIPVRNSFFIRRARVKFAYEAADGLKFVLQPDFAFDRVTLQDAFVVLNDRWTKTYSLFLGQFDRPQYETEYSSGNMEMLERTRMTNMLYPGQKELGAKFEANFEGRYKLPLKLQVAVMNGNFGLGTTSNQTRDVDNQKDVMARATYSLKFPNSGLGIDFGGHGYFGKTVVNAAGAGQVFSGVDNQNFTATVGQKLNKSWVGAEMQIYYDFLGGMSLKGEYITGTLSGVTANGAIAGVSNINANSNFNFNAVRDFRAFYIQLIKNIGVKNQFVARFDQWDPNRKMSGNQVKNVNDLKYNTFGVSWQYFFDENIKINAGYTIPVNEKSTGVAVANFNNRDMRDNTFSVRIQATF